MKKIMLDSNIFDELCIDFNLIMKNKEKYKFYITYTQIDEINNMPKSKSEKKNKILENIERLEVEKVKASVTILGKCRLGQTKIGRGKVYSKIVKDNGSNSNDSIIADTSVSEGCTLITNDKKLYNRMKRNNNAAMD